MGNFLQSVRSRLRPEEVGLKSHGKRRRVAGLRREEVALLAGVSVNYYTRLEQGQNRNASPEVLDALASALHLRPDERAHLLDLARSPRVGRMERPNEQVRPSLARMIGSFESGPAVLLDRQTKVLAWNRLASILFTGYIDLTGDDGQPQPPCLARLLFCAPGARQLYSEWMEEATDLVGYLRLMAGRYPTDAQLTGLIAELNATNAQFRTLWSEHRIWDKSHGIRHLNHPKVGALELWYETFRLPEAPDQVIVLYQAELGSPSSRALNSLLADVA
ncbi:helix-turn-helix transcriptional regulator [Streptomyces sp. NBC_01190]|nr:helix-turn-helix transcriptional regulator [Streptomyces sp. NBC_01190]